MCERLRASLSHPSRYHFEGDGPQGTQRWLSWFFLLLCLSILSFFPSFSLFLSLSSILLLLVLSFLTFIHSADDTTRPKRFTEEADFISDLMQQLSRSIVQLYQSVRFIISSSFYSSLSFSSSLSSSFSSSSSPHFVMFITRPFFPLSHHLRQSIVRLAVSSASPLRIF